MHRNDIVLHSQLKAVHCTMQSAARGHVLMLAWSKCDMLRAGGDQGSASGDLRLLDSGAR